MVILPPFHFKMGFCNRGFSGCPGSEPYRRDQCKRHRISARVKAKIAKSRGNHNDEYLKAVIKADTPAEDVSQIVGKGFHCSKECCKVQVVTGKDPIIPGGFLSKKLQLPQPISSPGQWEAKSATLCMMACCNSTLPVIEIHEQVTVKSNMLGLQWCHL